MKTASLLLAALAAAPALAWDTPTFWKTSANTDSSDSADSSASSGSGFGGFAGGGPNVPGAKGSSAFPLVEVQGVMVEPALGTESKTPGGRITKLRYGPYTVSGGEMQDYPLALNKLKTPCKDCYVTAFQAGLEYEDGSDANVETGMWLHHMVLHDNSHKDVNCFYQTQRIFATGNERVTRRVNTHGKWAYYVGRNDVFSDVHELMNESNESKKVWMTVKYEWLPADKADGYKKVTPIWLDVTGGCGIGDTPAQQGKYTLDMSWKSTVSGPFLEAVGHMHDGGVNTKIYVNGKAVCTSEQVYGGSPQYEEPASMGSMAGFKHISHCGVCQDFAQLNRGDKIRMTANYNDKVHKQMKEVESGKLMPVMGIVMGYVGDKSAF